MPLEELLAQACVLSHDDPSVAKVLPYLFHKRRNELDFGQLEHALAEHKQKHTGGFLLAVAGTLTNDAMLREWAERLRDKRRTKVVDFFSGMSGKRVQALAARNTPELAERWSFRLNMPMDEFRSVMAKFGRVFRCSASTRSLPVGELSPRRPRFCSPGFSKPHLSSG